MNPLQLIFRRCTNNRSRLGLVAFVLASLVFSDLAAMRHVGNCCGDDRSLDAGQAAQVAVAGNCSHHGCDRGNPFRRQPLSESAVSESAASESAAASEAASCPCSPSHDRDSCAVCRWFVVISAGVHINVPVTIRCGELVAEPIVAVAGQPARMIFLPTVSRRGPPAVA